MYNRIKHIFRYIILLVIIISSTVYPGLLNITSLALKKETSNKSIEPKTSANEITIITPENKTYTEPMSGYYPASSGFENDADGSDPVGWDVFEGAGYVNVKDEMLTHKKVVEMYDNTGANHDELHNSFSLQTNGTVEFWMLADDVSEALSIRLMDDTATDVWGPAIGWIQIYQDYIRYYDDTLTYYNVKSITDNTWYHVKIEFECSTGNYKGLAQDTWRFYVDGEQFGDFGFQNNIDNVTQIYIFTRGANYNYWCYIDAVGYSWDFAYDIGDNALEGLLLSFENSTTLDWIGYSLDGLTNKTILGNTSIPTPSDGLHNIQVFGNDSLGTMYPSKIRYFTITIPPIIAINLPALNEYFSFLPPDFDISITESNLDTMWYTIDDGLTNITFYSFTGTIDQTEWDKLDNGIVIIRFFANDSSGLLGYVEVSIHKDIDDPIITINSPVFNEEFIYPPGFSISIEESNLDTFWYTIDGGQTNVPITELIGLIDEDLWNAAQSGSLTIRFYARDKAGNIGYNDVIIVKLTPSNGGQAIPGFNLLIILGILSAVSVLFIKKRLKK